MDGGLGRIGRGQEWGIQNKDKKQKKDSVKRGRKRWRMGYCALGISDFWDH